MEKQKVYPGQETLETDVLWTNRFAEEAIAKLAEGLFGQNPLGTGLVCTPGTGLTVSVGEGALYSWMQLDATAYSTLAADTHMVLKQGLLRDPATLSTPAPATAGQAICYLIEAQVQVSDIDPVLLPYFDTSNPDLPWSGPNNDGTTNTTTRTSIVALQVVAGTPATAGQQLAPAADAGWAPLYVVTIANGATSVSQSNIRRAHGSALLEYPVTRIGSPAHKLDYRLGNIL